jgi:nitroreductase
VAEVDLTAVEVLTTTRAVRRRLDLERSVAREALADCVEIAGQAPSAVNKVHVSWLIVDEPGLRRSVAEVYRRAQNDWAYGVAGQPPQWNTASETISHEVLESARATMPPEMSRSVFHLREHLHEVPALVIPMLRGRPEQGANQAAFWGSIMPAMWSFMLALRMKGMGSAWTCVHLGREKEMAEVLGIPYDEYTQAGLIPVAHTIGTRFKRGPRPASVIRWNEGPATVGSAR